APVDAASQPAVVEAAVAPIVYQQLALPDLEGDLGQNALEPDTANGDERADGGCTIGALSIRLGSDGDGVVDGTFDDSVARAAMAYQQANDLYVDGVVGRESAIELDIWPDEESLVIRTPPPEPGATDSLGFALSVVSSTGDDAPPLPDNSGSGRRVVYDRGGQRVWAVASDGEIIRSWLVSGSKYSNELAGTHTVYSRSDVSTAWNGKAWLPQMIRWLKTDIGNIGFHAIPLKVSDNSVYQTSDELGTRLSGGCQRQANEDAAFLWEFAPVGTTIVVT
ncbi:MAG: murein L,D-transpeptidase, partial [Actinobacteria bacterium]|nr:murein L,D-transpeptidase [Actinomycetota bacterium]